MAEFAFAGVSKRFGRVAAVQDVTFAVGGGEFFVLLGPTGAGKTTVLRLLAGLERPDAGRIDVGGRDTRGLTPAALEPARDQPVERHRHDERAHDADRRPPDRELPQRVRP